MTLSFNTRSGDIRVQTPVDVEVGEEFQEGTARYRIEGFDTGPAGGTQVLCRLVAGQHPFYWVELAESPEMLRVDATFLARLIHQKRAFLASSRSL